MCTGMCTHGFNSHLCNKEKPPAGDPSSTVSKMVHKRGILAQGRYWLLMCDSCYYKCYCLLVSVVCNIGCLHMDTVMELGQTYLSQFDLIPSTSAEVEFIETG